MGSNMKNKYDSNLLYLKTRNSTSEMLTMLTPIMIIAVTFLLEKNKTVRSKKRHQNKVKAKKFEMKMSLFQIEEA